MRPDGRGSIHSSDWRGADDTPCSKDDVTCGGGREINVMLSFHLLPFTEPRIFAGYRVVYSTDLVGRVRRCDEPSLVSATYRIACWTVWAQSLGVRFGVEPETAGDTKSLAGSASVAPLRSIHDRGVQTPGMPSWATDALQQYSHAKPVANGHVQNRASVGREFVDCQNATSFAAFNSVRRTGSRRLRFNS